MNDMSAETPRSQTRRNLLKLGAVGGALLAAEGVRRILTGGSSAPSETVTTKPPPDATVAASPSRTPATATATPTLAPTPKPIDYVELAIKEGKLELKDEKDWEKYFIAITPEEAEELLAKANNSVVSESNYKYLFDFDPRKSPNLILQNFDFKTPFAIRHFLGVKNITIGTRFYAQFSGSGLITGNAQTLDAGVEKPTKELADIGLRRENNELFIPIDKITAVKIGDPLMTLNNTNMLQAYEGKYQAVMGFSLNSKPITNGFLENLLVKNGKIAFIAQN